MLSNIFRNTLKYGPVILGINSTATYIYNDRTKIQMSTDGSNHEPGTLRYDCDYGKKDIDSAWYHQKKIQRDNYDSFYKGVLTVWRKDDTKMTVEEFKRFVEYEIKHPLVSKYHRCLMECMLKMYNDEKYIMPSITVMPTRW